MKKLIGLLIAVVFSATLAQASLIENDADTSNPQMTTLDLSDTGFAATDGGISLAQPLAIDGASTVARPAPKPRQPASGRTAFKPRARQGATTDARIHQTSISIVPEPAVTSLIAFTGGGMLVGHRWNRRTRKKRALSA